MKKITAPDDMCSDDILLWGKYAKCKGQPAEWWYVETQTTSQGKLFTEKAKEVCFLCPVREQCLRYANENDESYGVWGGLTPQERGYKRLGRTSRSL